MSILEILKAEAAALEAGERAEGNTIKHAAALEQVAKSYGFRSWRALRGTLMAAASTTPNTPGRFEMKRYHNGDWQFGIDVPKRWNAFPAVPTNSPYEVIRFASHEDGEHLVIIFRGPLDPKTTLKAHFERNRKALVNAGFGNFATGMTAIGTRPAPTLDFDKPKDGGIWSCRHYVLFAGTLVYTLGFGTSRRDEMITTFDRMAKSFAIEEAGS